ncbi:GAF domain-containing protein [Paenarthrobacter sp. S56]|uniref:GAF domain-containing sensor histidine kinase n=1 Tax=Paenarthrobacter sp. S56 TaxID=3138179 RepID=UPI00321B152E
MMNHPYQRSPEDRPASSVPLDELLRSLLSRAGELLTAEERTRGLLEAVVTVAEDLSLEAVLKRVVEAACHLLQARYGALGVIGEDNALSHFVTVGMEADVARRIGPLPTGHGVLGLLITEPAPLRLHDLREHPNAFGFPENHPPMKSFLGVPVRVRDTVFGNLYLTEKEDGDFTPEDEDLAVALAAAAGVAIENARLYEDARRRTSWLEGCMNVTGKLLDGGLENQTEESSYAVVAAGALEQTECRLALALAPDDDGSSYFVAATAGGTSPDLPLALASLRDRVPPGASMAIDDEWDLLNDGRGPDRAKLLVMDLNAQGSHYGYLVLVRDPGTGNFSATDVEMGAVFGSHAALALALDRIRRLREQSVVFSDRDRIARDLHDLVIQRLFAAGLSIQSLRRYTANPAAPVRIDAITDELDASIRDLRNTIYSLRAAASGRQLLSSRIMERVQSGSAALPFAPHLVLTGKVDALEDETIVENLLAVVSEGLSNAVRHSEAGSITISVAVAPDSLTVEVSDDGRGFEHAAAGNGLANLVERAAGLNGSCTITSRPGHGTSFVWTVPLL